VPAEIGQIRVENPERAKQIQASIAEQFDRHFQAGLAVIGFEKTTDAGVYLLGTWESK